MQILLASVLTLALASASDFHVCTISCEPVVGFLLNFPDFGDLDLIFKVTAVEKLKFRCGGHLFSLKTPLLVMS